MTLCFIRSERMQSQIRGKVSLLSLLLLASSTPVTSPRPVLFGNSSLGVPSPLRMPTCKGLSDSFLQEKRLLVTELLSHPDSEGNSN
ncbi:hypothetical protein BO82DRAFT_106390 [Aspergillus uvarum CBS 121591]|uniref:Uncharacterized protein n=1 Tax=Aspergillus uvarum CBS 121591 TaxID=1448315 RepID=A0A319C5X2_9EURO|nr:hypothetical protein BO82DRAFT_106390 [Aspergillus uvarum CBS 121591]PYH80655.1 hypothetical protein BO82DRAFT_106390 [Aspergillus uvarum CBS 121591]